MPQMEKSLQGQMQVPGRSKKMVTEQVQATGMTHMPMSLSRKYQTEGKPSSSLSYGEECKKQTNKQT